MKYKIERNTVQETLILPLYSRKLCSELYPNLYRDETAVRLIDQIDCDFSVAEKNSRSLMQRFGALEVAMRQWRPCVGGAGLSEKPPLRGGGQSGAAGWTTPAEPATTADAKSTIWTSRMLLPCGSSCCPPGEREQNIPCDLKDPAWFDKIDASGGAVFFASGVFYYFLTQQVRELVQGMADAFLGGVLVLMRPIGQR
mgnify:CR=1 FL=1